MLDTILQSVGGLRAIQYEPIAVIVELILIGLSVNWCAGVLHGTRGTRPLRGVLMVLVVATLVVNVLAAQFDWPRMALLYRYFVVGLAFVALVAFQPELRRAVIRAGDVQFRRRGTKRVKIITSLVQTARFLSKNRFGGLVAIQRAVDLAGWAEKGTTINAEVSANLLNSIFYPNSPLHDLGVIIAGNRLLAANCQFPVAESDEVGTALGSRHLAAVGMSYESDALVLIVSEETGTISLADNGRLTRFLSIDDLEDELTARLSGATTPKMVEDKGLSTASRIWRVVRRTLVVTLLTLIIWVLANQATQTEIAGVAVRINLVTKDAERIADPSGTQPDIFKVTIRGSQRAIAPLRDITSDNPLTVDWLVEDTYPLGVLQQQSVIQVLNRINRVERQGWTIEEASPPNIVFTVDRLESVQLPIVAAPGRVQVTDVRFDPENVTATMRGRDVRQLESSGETPQILLPLDSRLREYSTGQRVNLSAIRVPERVSGLPVVAVSPREVSVSLQIAGQKVTGKLADIPVRLMVNPAIFSRYDISAVDQQEWKIEIEVEGDADRIAELTPQKVLAYVTIPSDLLTETSFYRAQVEFTVPEGIKVLSERSVQLRITQRDDAAP